MVGGAWRLGIMEDLGEVCEFSYCYMFCFIIFGSGLFWLKVLFLGEFLFFCSYLIFLDFVVLDYFSCNGVEKGM